VKRLHQKGHGTVFGRLSPQSVIMRTNHDDRNGVSRLVQLALQVQAVRSRKVKTTMAQSGGSNSLKNASAGTTQSASIAGRFKKIAYGTLDCDIVVIDDANFGNTVLRTHGSLGPYVEDSGKQILTRESLSHTAPLPVRDNNAMQHEELQ